MASSTTAKKSKKKGRCILVKKFFQDLIKRPKSGNNSASQSNLISLSTFGAHNPAPGNDAGSGGPTASNVNATSNQGPTTPFRSARFPSSSISGLPDSAVGQANSQSQVSDWKTPSKDGLGVASRFTQMLIKKVPGCVSANPVAMAFSIAKAIIEIKDAIGSNKDKLLQLLDETAIKLLAVERTVDSGVPEAAEEAMKNLKTILGEEMKKLTDLSDKSLAIKKLDHDAYGPKIQQIFERVKEATMTFIFEMTKTTSKILDKATLEGLNPSVKADHKTFLEVQGLKREVCANGTCVKILEDITNWANDRSLASPRVFWLTGQAGSGKTTIAYTIAKQFEEYGNADQHADQHTVLGGKFLCSRQFQETRVQNRIIPAIAYQLAHKCKSYANALHVSDKFNAASHDVSSQMKDLFEPWLSKAKHDPKLPLPPLYLIVIDALDEIEDGGGSAFLRGLLTVINKYDLRGLKFLVTSRSDPKVVELCQSFASKVCRLQDVPIKEAESDIETYLKTQLPKLAGSPKFVELGQRAGGLFIYAATVVKYLTPHDSITVKEQSEMLDDFLSKSYEPASSGDGTSPVDELYRQIMCDAFSKFNGKFLARRLCTLYTFLCMTERTSASIVAALVPDGDVETARAVLRDLHAVLYTSHDDRVFWYHASFPDFIFNQARSNFRSDEMDFKFWCNEPAHHSLLGKSCFSIMKSEKSGLRFNMGNITSSFQFDNDNRAALLEQVNRNISPVLRYSSRYWTHHLPFPQMINIDDLCGCISEFLQIRVLFWIEAMNLLGLRNRCTPMLQFARQWVLKCGNGYSELAREIGEAASFATYFTGSPAAESTPHLYVSALATWSRDTSLSRKWKRQFTRIPVFTYSEGGIDLPLMTISTGTQIHDVAFSCDGRIVSAGTDFVKVWDASTGVELKELKNTGLVLSVAFSSDGTRIVSGSYDKYVRVWDVSTGAELKKLNGHTNWVYSVAFSSDGMRIVSGSYDMSVRVWDVLTGVELKKLGHTEPVNSVAFSSDGMWIVSGSDGGSVWVWDALTGVEAKKLKGSGVLKSVAFSSDGTKIVSGSSDWSVRVWDASRGVKLKEMTGHTGPVSSVAFSSDGIWIVSGSHDNSVRVWDASTGVALKELVGHTGSVNSVAFSSDGTRIVSGSVDKLLQVWDMSMGVGLELKKLKGYTGCVNSVAFSSDGIWIVSGFNDSSVRMWDASTGVQLKELRGHNGSVTSVAFSSDDTKIVSGSSDLSVRVWNVSTGVVLKELKGHTGTVLSVAFSNDGTQIVSSSHDRSVRVWDVLTGMKLMVLLHNGPVNSVAYSSDGMCIVSGSYDNNVWVWDASTGSVLNEIKHTHWSTLSRVEQNDHNRWITSVAFSNDGTQIVSASTDNSVRVWDTEDGEELMELCGHTGSVNSVAFSSDDTLIVSGADDNTVRVWDVSTGEELKVLRGHNGLVKSVAFSSDGTKIVSGSNDNSVRVWDVSMITGSCDSYEEIEESEDVLPDNSWILSSQGQDHLMWVPQEANLIQDDNILIISPSGCSTVDFDQSRIGVDWVHCYTPS